MRKKREELFAEWDRARQADMANMICAYSMRYSRDGRLTIPAGVRAAFHFSAGDYINLFVDPDQGIAILPVSDRLMDPVTYEYHSENSSFDALFLEWLHRTDRQGDYVGYSRSFSGKKLALPEEAVDAIGYQPGDLLPMIFHAKVGVLIPARKRIEQLLAEAFHIRGI